MESARDDTWLTLRRQHMQIEELLDELERVAETQIANGYQGPAELPLAITALRTRLLRHFAYEEAALGVSHDDQRARIDGLFHDRRVFGDRSTLAREARVLVHFLRRAMADEDRRLASTADG